jgi:hypothetical protein
VLSARLNDAVGQVVEAQSTRTHLKNDFTVILNEILLSVNLDEVKNLVRIGHFQADSSTCQKHKSQNDDEKSVFEIASRYVALLPFMLLIHGGIPPCTFLEAGDSSRSVRQPSLKKYF